MWTLHTDSGNTVYGGQTAKNIYLGENRIVTKLNGANDPTYQEEYYKQYYYHSDHLGSASLISDYKGDEYQRIEYTPYGETWMEKTSNTGMEYLPYKFTGKEMDEETGLYYYGARYLDPKYSMWISTDPALGEYIPIAPTNDEAKRHNSNLPGMGGVFNHINFNLYHYAGNNPVKYTDPDGKTPKLPALSPKDFFSFIFEHDCSAKTVRLYSEAINGDKAAQAVAKDATIAAGKTMAITTLDGVELTADVISEVSGDISLVGFAVGNPEVAGAFGTVSECTAIIGLSAAGAKAALTGEEKDLNNFLSKGCAFGISTLFTTVKTMFNL